MDTDKIYAFLGSAIIHILILLIMGYSVMRTIVPEEEEGILVNFGNVDAAAGTFEPQYTGDIPPRSAPPASVFQQPQPDRENLLTQDMEESVAIEESRRREERRIEEERQTALAEQRRREEEQRQRENTINSRVAGAFGSNNTGENSQGDAESGTGNQGSPFGNADRGANDGIGGYGSFNLNGRSLGSGGLPRPDYNVQEEGRIVINITVDPRGAVIFAEIGRGTNIDNASLRQSAISAARKAKFNSIASVNNQSGTITYNYKLTQ
ncbi:MAG: energy transducer TonB [Tannerellaceae bacterium]|nr:energy transducer TonB [Tannerellaceae bacterium]